MSIASIDIPLMNAFQPFFKADILTRRVVLSQPRPHLMVSNEIGILSRTPLTLSCHLPSSLSCRRALTKFQGANRRPVVLSCAAITISFDAATSPLRRNMKHRYEARRACADQMATLPRCCQRPPRCLHLMLWSWRMARDWMIVIISEGVASKA